jgi:hypothetical protein
MCIYNGIMTEVELNEGSLHMMNLLKYLVQQYTGLLFLWSEYSVILVILRLISDLFPNSSLLMAFVEIDLYPPDMIFFLQH